MNWEQWRKRCKSAGQVASAQFMVQIINAVTGVLILRSVEKPEYACFTIINTVTGALASVGDSGITSSVLSRGGKVWQDRERFSRLISTGSQLRMVILAIAALAAVPWAVWMLMRNGASALKTALLILSLLAGCLAVSETVILAVVPRLRSEYGFTQKVDLMGAFLRLVLSGVALLFWRTTLPLVLAVSLSQWWSCIQMSRHADRVLDRAAPQSPEDRTAILKTVRSLWFPSLFACFQAQIGTLLLSIFAARDSVADLGAVSRFGVIFSVLMAVIHHLASPAFARGRSASSVRSMFLQSLGLLVLFCAGITCLSWVLPEPFFWILGPSYGGLSSELVLFFIMQSLSMLVQHFWALASARGWFTLSWLIPPATLVVQAVLAGFLQFQTLSGTLWFMIWSQLPPLVVVAMLIYRGFRQWPQEEAAE